MQEEYSCRECGRLWNAFVEAAKEYGRLENQLQAAVRSHDSLTMLRLERSMESAAAATREAREAMHAHHSAAHEDSVHRVS